MLVRQCVPHQGHGLGAHDASDASLPTLLDVLGGPWPCSVSESMFATIAEHRVCTLLDKLFTVSSVLTFFVLFCTQNGRSFRTNFFPESDFSCFTQAG